MVQRELEGWRSVQQRGDDGEIESDERVRAARPVVELSDSGARLLGDHYWLEVERASHGFVRRRDTRDGVELRLFRHGPCLLSFGHAETAHDSTGVSCRFPIRGGLLARRPGGELALSQITVREPELRAAITGFVPRLGLRPYDHLQRRLHVEISRRYFRQLINQART